MAIDVLHPRDGIVHEQTESENQREECDAVDCVPQQVVAQQREGVGDRNGQSHDDARPPTHCERQKADDRHDGESKALHQVVDLVVGSFPVVACHLHAHAIGDYGAFQFLQQGLYLACNPDGVAALLLSHGNRHCGIRTTVLTGACRAPGEPRVCIDFLRSIDHICDVAQVDGAIPVDANHEVLHLADIPQEGPGTHLQFPVGTIE